jgi:hypothetical protein
MDQSTRWMEAIPIKNRGLRLCRLPGYPRSGFLTLSLLTEELSYVLQNMENPVFLPGGSSMRQQQLTTHKVTEGSPQAAPGRADVLVASAQCPGHLPWVLLDQNCDNLIIRPGGKSIHEKRLMSNIRGVFTPNLDRRHIWRYVRRQGFVMKYNLKNCLFPGLFVSAPPPRARVS